MNSRCQILFASLCGMPLAQQIWFTCEWGLSIIELGLNNVRDWIIFILRDAKLLAILEGDRMDDFFVFTARSMDRIRMMRNKIHRLNDCTVSHISHSIASCANAMVQTLKKDT